MVGDIVIRLIDETCETWIGEIDVVFTRLVQITFFHSKLSLRSLLVMSVFINRPISQKRFGIIVLFQYCLKYEYVKAGYLLTMHRLVELENFYHMLN